MITRLIKSHREWLRDSGAGVLEYTTGCVESDLADGSLPALRTMTSSLRGLALYYGTKGVIGLVDKLPGAWDDVYLSCAFHLHGLRLRFALWTRLGDEPGLTLTISDIASALCFSLANGLSEWTQQFADMISQAEWNDQMVRHEYWESHKFEPFALRLAQIDGGGDANAPPVSESPNVYSGLLANWNSPDLLTPAIEAACDYHCENMEETRTNADWGPEFDEPPFDLIPWEILAVCQIRNRLGLPMPEVKHPLVAHVVNFVPRNKLPVDSRINAVEQLRESLSMIL